MAKKALRWRKVIVPPAPRLFWPSPPSDTGPPRVVIFNLGAGTSEQQTKLKRSSGGGRY